MLKSRAINNGGRWAFNAIQNFWCATMQPALQQRQCYVLPTIQDSSSFNPAAMWLKGMPF